MMPNLNFPKIAAIFLVILPPHPSFAYLIEDGGVEILISYASRDSHFSYLTFFVLARSKPHNSFPLRSGGFFLLLLLRPGL